MKQRIFKIILSSMAVVLIVLGYFLYNPIRTILSLKKLDDYPLYTATYYGGYAFDTYLEKGDEGGSTIAYPCYCSVFACLGDKNNSILGRNFDYFNRPSLLLYTNPPDGYASVSMVDITDFGFSAEGEPGLHEKLALLCTPLYPFDGMNEMGVAIGMMGVEYGSYDGDPEKRTIHSLSVMRKVLDYASSLEEALELMDDHNIDFSRGNLHYLLADRKGNSAVVEYVAGVMRVLRSKEPWQAARTFVISETSADSALVIDEGYSHICKTLNNSSGVLSMSEVMSLLKDVSASEVSWTMWSVAYGMSTGEIQVAVGRQYDNIYSFRLDMLE